MCYLRLKMREMVHPVDGAYRIINQAVASFAFFRVGKETRLKFDGGEGACFHDFNF